MPLCQELRELGDAYNNFVVMITAQVEVTQFKLDAMASLLQELFPEKDVDAMLSLEFFKVRLKGLLDLQATAKMVGSFQIFSNTSLRLKHMGKEGEEKGYSDDYRDITENYVPQLNEEISNLMHQLPDMDMEKI